MVSLFFQPITLTAERGLEMGPSIITICFNFRNLHPNHDFTGVFLIWKFQPPCVSSVIFWKAWRQIVLGGIGIGPRWSFPAHFPTAVLQGCDQDAESFWILMDSTHIKSPWMLMGLLVSILLTLFYFWKANSGKSFDFFFSSPDWISENNHAELGLI